MSVNKAKALKLDVPATRSTLTALFENAVDALKGTPEPNRKITYGITPEENWLLFTLKDTGCGIPQEQMENLFTPFYSTKGADGTGLGLFLARQVVEEHGGSLGIESREGEGAKVCLRLPV